MLPREGGFAIMLQETGIATRAQEMHVAAALRDKGYTHFFSSQLAETGATSTSRGGGLLTAVSSKYVAEHEVLSFTEIVPGKAAALEIGTDRGGLTLINVHGPGAGCSPWAGRAAFWADIQMYATARSLGGRHPVVITGDTNVYMDVTSDPATEHFRAGWEACGVHAPSVPAQGRHLPGQRAPRAVVPAGKRLGPWHGTPPCDRVGPPPGRLGPAVPPQRGRARGDAHPLQPHGGPPPPVRC